MLGKIIFAERNSKVNMLKQLSISCLVSGVLLNIFVPSTCVEHLDWSYDPDTNTINKISANGTITYSCTKRALLNTRQLACKNCSEYLSEMFSPMEVTAMSIIMNAFADDNVTCFPAIPTREEIFQKIDDIYQSALNDSLASGSWFSNITCSIVNETRAMNKSEAVIKELRAALWNAYVAYNITKVELPNMRNEIAGLESVLRSCETVVKENEEAATNSLKEWTDNIDHLQQELPLLEMMAVSDTPEFAPSTWQLLASNRKVLMDYVLSETHFKYRLMKAQHEAALTKIELVSKKAEANERVAYIEHLMNEVTYHMEQARLADRGDDDEMYY